VGDLQSDYPRCCRSVLFIFSFVNIRHCLAQGAEIELVIIRMLTNENINKTLDNDFVNPPLFNA
jgi:hypothetical protein